MENDKRSPQPSGRNGTLWKWEYDEEGATALGRPLFGREPASAIVGQWERENRRSVWQGFQTAFNTIAHHGGKLLALLLAFVVGAVLASGPQSTAANIQLREKLRRAESETQARTGELALARIELARLNSILEHSKRYAIPADLAASIYDIAVSEGIDPRIAFGLVSVESDFTRKAISNKGALGLTQVMPATARLLQPGISSDQLFDRETNLRLGFRFLREMINYYNGDLHLALTAYNRGPGVVDRIRREGGDPTNGYARNVLRKGIINIE